MKMKMSPEQTKVLRKRLQGYMRELAVSLLDDEHGITTDAYRKLINVLEQTGTKHSDIQDTTRSQNGRVYLPIDYSTIP
jgi:hypothetical protein